MWFLYILIGLIFGGLFVYFYLKPKMKTFVEMDNKTLQINQELINETSNLKFELTELNAQKKEILNSISDLEKNANDISQKMLKQNIELANNSFEHQA